MATTVNGNNSVNTAYDLFDSWGLSADGNVADSATIPHASVYSVTEAGARDWYVFTLTATTTVLFDVDGGMNDIDTWLTLYNSNLAVLANHDDGGVTDPGSIHPWDVHVSYTLPAGTYYVEISRFPHVDFNGGTDYTLHVSADNLADSITAPTAPVDTDPAGDLAGANATVAEDLAVGSPIGLDAHSTDAGGAVTYSFGFNPDTSPILVSGPFSIDNATGVVTLSGALDYETQNSYSLTIHASDGLETSSSSFTVNVTNVNETPDAVDDDLSPGATGVLNVGYYDMGAGQGHAGQVATIIAAGHTPVLITDLSAAELAGIDMLIVNNPYGNRAEYLSQMSAITAAVSNGLILIVHDREVANGEQLLPGSAGFSIVEDFADADEVNFIDDAHSVASGPGGSLDDSSLDTGTASTHGFAIAGTLPSDADLILSTNNADQVVTFAYSHGDGHVIYSSIPLDHYLYYDWSWFRTGGIWDNADNYMVNLIDYAANDLDEPALTDEDTAIVIDGADLLANDTDPDGDTLTISGVSATSALGAAVTLNGDGTIGYDPTGALDYLAEGEVVEDTFTYTVDDGNGGTDTATVKFKVVGINDGPSAPVDIDPAGDTLTADATISEHLAVGSNIGIEADSTDPEGDPVTYYFRDGTNAIVQTLGKFTIDANTGVVTLAAEVNFELETSYTITIYASDGSLESSATFDVEITNVVEHLFTPNNDGTEAAPIDFNALPPGAYDYDGAQYDALAGDDFVYLPNLATSALPGHAWDYSMTFNASAGNDLVQGGDGNDIISGGDGNDRLFGGDGDDRLVGAAGDDILAGGDGSDKMTGSSGRDIFILTDSELGTTKTGEHDVITDFQQGTDKIDISALYDDGVMFGGLRNGALTGNAASANKVGYYSASGRTWLEGDVTGDGVADWVLEMSGSYKLKGSDLLVSQSIIETQAQWSAATGGLNYDRHHQDDYFIV